MASLGLLALAALLELVTAPFPAWAFDGVSVPEPATIILVGAGAGAAGVAAWWKRRQRK